MVKSSNRKSTDEWAFSPHYCTAIRKSTDEWGCRPYQPKNIQTTSKEKLAF